MEDTQRIVTAREVYDVEFGFLHRTCLELVCKEVKEMSEFYKIPLECFDVSALTFQKYKMWVDNKNYIEKLKQEKQEEINKKFGKQKELIK